MPIKPDVELQPHQERVEGEASEGPIRKLLYHGLGSGKTLTALAAAEARNTPYTAAMPASLRENFRGEQAKFTDQLLPSSVMSYSELARGRKPKHPKTLVFDEAQRLAMHNPAGGVISLHEMPDFLRVIAAQYKRTLRKP